MLHENMRIRLVLPSLGQSPPVCHIFRVALPSFRLNIRPIARSTLSMAAEKAVIHLLRRIPVPSENAAKVCIIRCWKSVTIETTVPVSTGGLILHCQMLSLIFW